MVVGVRAVGWSAELPKELAISWPICQPSHLSAKRLKQRNGNEKMIGLPIWCYEWPKTARERLGEKVISRENRIRSNTPFLQEKCCQFTDRWRTVAVTCESFLCILCLFVCFCLFVFFLFLLFPGTSTVLSSFTSYWQAFYYSLQTTAVKRRLLVCLVANLMLMSTRSITFFTASPPASQSRRHIFLRLAVSFQ